MSEKWVHLKKVLATRICGWTVPIVFIAALIFVVYAFFGEVGFWGWLVERIQNWIHLWF